MRIKRLYLVLVLVTLMAIVFPASALGQVEKKDLVIRFSPGSYPYEVKIGQDNIFYLEIENTGNVAINNIMLSRTRPRAGLSKSTR